MSRVRWECRPDCPVCAASRRQGARRVPSWVAPSLAVLGLLAVMALGGWVS